MTRADSAPEEPTLIRHAETAEVTNEWVPVTRVRMSRRIVTEIQTLEVEVRREELVITQEPVRQQIDPLPLGRAPIMPEARVFVLHAEVPSVSLTVMPVERVTVTPRRVTAYRDLEVALTAEHLAVEPSRLEPPPLEPPPLEPPLIPEPAQEGETP